jgi:hypothetical protein
LDAFRKLEKQTYPPFGRDTSPRCPRTTWRQNKINSADCGRLGVRTD